MSDPMSDPQVGIRPYLGAIPFAMPSSIAPLAVLPSIPGVDWSGLTPAEVPANIRRLDFDLSAANDDGMNVAANGNAIWFVNASSAAALVEIRSGESGDWIPFRFGQFIFPFELGSALRIRWAAQPGVTVTLAIWRHTGRIDVE